MQKLIHNISHSYAYKILIGLLCLLCFDTACYAHEPSFNILVTNDDGISTMEIRSLVKGLKDVGQVYVVAPDRNKSGTGNSVTPDWSELKADPIVRDGKLVGYAIIDGFPADTVRLAIKKLYANIKFDLVVSGINQGLNHGKLRYKSGTVGAAVEALDQGIPAIAISQDRQGESQTTRVAVAFAKDVVRQVKSHGLPKGVLLNINVPKGVIKGIVLAPRKTSFQTEKKALQEGCITLSPLKRDLDDDNSLDHFDTWDLGLKRYY